VTRLFAFALALALLLTGCSDDEPKSEPDEKPTLSAPPTVDAALPATVAQAVTPAHLDPVCPGGQFRETVDVLDTLPAAYAERADRIFAYDCDDLIDQVVWAELPNSQAAAELLDPEAAEGAVMFVADNTVLAVAARLVDEGLDVAAYFQDLADNCGCGTYDVTSVR
jgi:hypothetical protein